MSLYNLMNGVNPATFLILPMLGEKHADDYPRFRDCFIDADDNIAVFTRVGGQNRNCGYGEELLQVHPNFLKDYDSEEDSTYAIYVFSVPEKWKKDFIKIKENKLTEVSVEYKQRLYTVYPKLTNIFDTLFS